MRNTAPCIAYAGWKIKSKNPDAAIVVTPSDHIVTDVPEFQRVISVSLDFVNHNQAILTLGMRPTRPETGYGYIAARQSGVSNGEIFPVESFREKPSLDVARQYLEAGNYFWNSGLFLWHVQTLEKAFRTYCPAIADVFDRLAPSFYTPGEQSAIDEMFPLCENISVDYAVMEKASDMYVFPADFGWSDLGTWGSLHTLLPRDESGNACVGDSVKMIDSHRCIVHVPAGKRVVVQGLDGYIVAEKDGTLLICRLEDEQHIKEYSK
jgi:mannose-1-phosphate guanylyltransferase